MERIVAYIKSQWRWIFPLVYLMILTPLTPTLDLKIEHFFFQGYQFSSHPFFQFFYDYGCWPALFVSGISFLVFILSLKIKQLKPWRKTALMLLLPLIIGSGLIAHGLLKDHWGRPRPKQIVAFGGNQKFVPYYSMNLNSIEPSKSFPCGHATMGYYFFCVALLGERLSNKMLIKIGYMLAFVLGILLSLSRMAQGGHFLSDTLISAYIMWISSLFSGWFVFERRNHAGFD